jgi:hypothetical protein
VRTLFFCLMLTLSAVASADDLTDANRALIAKSYSQALQLFTKLAAAGNPEAQLRLGEMYWYGEGVGLDRAKGDVLFAQAAANGNKEAVAAQSLSANRAQRSAEIAYWTSGYDGADLTAGKYNCVAPKIPAMSTTNTDIKAVSAAVSAWSKCQEAFSANMGAAMPPGKQIPAAVAIVMSEQETQQAKMHLDKVYGAVMEKAQVSASAVVAEHEKWQNATRAYVAEQNLTIEARNKQAKVDLEQQQRLRDDANSLSRAGPAFKQR